MLEATYDEVRYLMKPGDVVLFGGTGWLSKLIRWGTRSPVSHAGMISFSHPDDDPREYRVRVTDSTSLDGRCGVVTRYLSEVVQEYVGRVWWLPLCDDARDRADLSAMKTFLQLQEGARYDFWQVTRAAFRALVGFNLTPVQADHRRVFCSEYVAYALQEGGVFHWSNCSSVTPAELAAAPIYRSECWQIKGTRKEIPNYNGDAS